MTLLERALFYCVITLQLLNHSISLLRLHKAATQNVFKYTQTHREIKVLADTSYCFDVYALAIVNNTLLTSSCTLHSRKFLR